ncbi:hypothetical protein Y032_0163g3490 [Ancylostoma ceylanicum]|uniref:Uncharacterized protein n=1 Tax=Ancylostoma ceylanicum TaxID=53326 RepID=A0A016SXD8_9BILA|nr:hypothetical protein Y032_0163g3490 [Ancylostoma ceylanicum]
MTKPGCRRIDRQALLWMDEVKLKMHEKKHAYHVFLNDKTVDVHQVLAFSSLLSILVMDAMTRNLQGPAPWVVLADDVTPEQKEERRRINVSPTPEQRLRPSIIHRVCNSLSRKFSDEVTSFLLMLQFLKYDCDSFEAWPTGVDGLLPTFR